jgi:hypothetical protein
MILINFEIRKKSKPNFPPTLKGPCLYLLMGLNVYLGLLVEVDDVTSISTILLTDVEVRNLSLYIYLPTLGQSTLKLPQGEPHILGIPR